MHERFVAAVVEKVSQIRVDQGLQQEFVVGPLINQAGFDKVVELVDETKRMGATALLGGKPHAKGGLFYEPTVLANLHDDMRSEEHTSEIQSLMRISSAVFCMI